jgi:hypothetical protein
MSAEEAKKGVEELAGKAKKEAEAAAEKVAEKALELQNRFTNSERFAKMVHDTFVRMVSARTTRCGSHRPCPSSSQLSRADGMDPRSSSCCCRSRI